MSSEAMDKIQQDPISRGIYEALMSRLADVGEFEVEGKKTSLHIVHGRAFLGLHPRRNALLVTIVTNEPIQSPRAVRTEQVSKSRYHNEVLLSSVGEVDDELMGWAKRAYELLP
jgi:hypothetical protein